MEPLHTRQVPPPVPQAPLVVPGWQLVPSQQPPLHCTPPEQSVPQWLFLHACPGEQSVEAEQPHVPPGSQTGVEPEQDAQAPPPEPQAFVPVPGWHMEPSQQPPLHMRPPAHDGEHCPPLHASPTGQSLADTHPHAPDRQR